MRRARRRFAKDNNERKSQSSTGASVASIIYQRAVVIEVPPEAFESEIVGL